MTTLLVTHPAFLEHLVPAGHPERPDRLRAINAALSVEAFAPLKRCQAPDADVATLLTAHEEAHVAAIRSAIPEVGFTTLDADTFVSPASYAAATRAAGAACLAVDEVLAGTVSNAFCAVRPPGHHAEASRAMGFCLFNNAVIAARRAQSRHNADRVAIVDFDVHHGNGSQAILWSDPSILYASTHQMPLYPGTGAAEETGAGNIFNAPLPPGSGGAEFREAFSRVLLPEVDRFAPDLIVVSAGFDAHRRDPLASLDLDEADFIWVTNALGEVAARHSGGRMVSLLEGGYDLEGLAKSVAAHIETLMKG